MSRYLQPISPVDKFYCKTIAYPGKNNYSHSCIAICKHNRSVYVGLSMLDLGYIRFYKYNLMEGVMSHIIDMPETSNAYRTNLSILADDEYLYIHAVRSSDARTSIVRLNLKTLEKDSLTLTDEVRDLVDWLDDDTIVSRIHFSHNIALINKHTGEIKIIEIPFINQKTEIMQLEDNQKPAIAVGRRKIMETFRYRDSSNPNYDKLYCVKYDYINDVVESTTPTVLVEKELHHIYDGTHYVASEDYTSYNATPMYSNGYFYIFLSRQYCGKNSEILAISEDDKTSDLSWAKGLPINGLRYNSIPSISDDAVVCFRYFRTNSPSSKDLIYATEATYVHTSQLATGSVGLDNDRSAFGVTDNNTCNINMKDYFFSATYTNMTIVRLVSDAKYNMGYKINRDDNVIINNTNNIDISYDSNFITLHDEYASIHDGNINVTLENVDTTNHIKKAHMSKSKYNKFKSVSFT